MKLITKLLLPLLLFTTAAHAEWNGHRLGIGVGVAKLGDSQAYVAVGGEYEYRLHPMLGMGGFANYVFSDPGVTLLGVPMVYFHPLAGNWYINASPIVEFGSGRKTEYGARVGTRAPLELGALVIIPQVAVDFIAGRQNLLFGLGIGI